MEKRRKRNYITYTVFVILTVLLSVVVYSIDIENIFYNRVRNIFIFCYYIFLIGMWGVNCIKRISRRRVRFYFIAIAVNMLLFFLLRSFRWFVVLEAGTLNRLCWYLFYVPMLLIPYSAFLCALCLGKAEDYRIPRPLLLGTLVPTILLLLAMVTNNLHMWCFSFREEEFMLHGTYKYELLYFVTAAWMFGLIIAAIVLIIRAGRNRRSRRDIYIPWVIIGGSVIYCVIYVLDIADVRSVLDLTVFYCVITGILLESLIYLRLVRTNQEYAWCFDHASLDMQITDRVGRVCYAAVGAAPVDEETASALKQGARSVLQGDREITMQPIRGGYLFVANDIRLLKSTQVQAEQVNSELIRINRTLSESIKLAEERESLEQSSRLYNKCYKETEGVIRLMQGLIEMAEEETDEEKKREYLALLNIHGVYVKRRSNLIILNEDQTENAGGELVLCLKETMNNLRLFGIKVESSVKELTNIRIESVILMYDFLEEILITLLPDVRQLYILVTQADGENVINLHIYPGKKRELPRVEDWEPERRRLQNAELFFEQEDEPEGFTISLRIPEQTGREVPA